MTGFLASWIVLGILILAYPTVQKIKDEKLFWFIKIPILVALVIGIVADVLFNALWGSIIFRELPHEWLFTDRLKRHWYGQDAKQKERARKWVSMVNLIDPGHV